MIVYKDGTWKPIEETQVSVMDHGFLYGVGLFETFRTYNGVPFLFMDHLQRLKEGLESVFIDWQYEEQELRDLVTQALQQNKLQDGVIRLNVTAGISNWGLPTETYNKPTLLLFTRPVPPMSGSAKKAEFLTLRRNTPEGEYRLKSHHYLNNLLGKRELGSKLDVEGFFLTEQGYVAEGLVSNVFWIKEDTLYTPSLETGILKGVTRQFVLHLAELIGLTVKIGLFAKEDLLGADAVFITNSTQELVPINSVSGKAFSMESQWLKKLQRLYKESTGEQLLTYQEVKRVEEKNGKYQLISN